MDKGGAPAADALPSFDPAFSLRKKSTGYGPILFPPALLLSSPSRPGFVYNCELFNLFKSERWHPLKDLLVWPTLNFVFLPGIEGPGLGIMAGKTLTQTPQFTSAEACGIGGTHRKLG